MAKTIQMGLNTEPVFELPENFNNMTEENKKYWSNLVNKATSLKEEIHQVIAEDGTCELSWSCDGRSRHEMHAHQWATALPQYNFTIGYNYECTVSSK